MRLRNGVPGPSALELGSRIRSQDSRHRDFRLMGAPVLWIQLSRQPQCQVIICITLVYVSELLETNKTQLTKTRQCHASSYYKYVHVILSCLFRASGGKHKFNQKTLLKGRSVDFWKCLRLLYACVCRPTLVIEIGIRTPTMQKHSSLNYLILGSIADGCSSPTQFHIDSGCQKKQKTS